MPPARGTAIHCSALSEREVLDIRRRYANWQENGCTITGLAEEYDVCISTIYNVITRKSWAWLEDDVEDTPHRPRGGVKGARLVNHDRILALRIQGLPYKVISERLGFTVNSLKVIVHREKARNPSIPRLHRHKRIDIEQVMYGRTLGVPYKILAREFNSTAESLKTLVCLARKRKGAEAPKLP